jgi:dienelactone hydrolase
MKRAVFASLILIFIFSVGFLGGIFYSRKNKVPNLITNVVTQRLLDKYTIDNLKNSNIPAGRLVILNKISDNDKSISYEFSFEFSPTLDPKGDSKKTSGLINIPNNALNSSNSHYPLILMLRGYVDQAIYKTGDGTRNAAKYFADNGFITLAPDFLGYGDSDPEAGNIFESRFQTYTTVLTLLKTIEDLKNNSELISVSNQLRPINDQSLTEANLITNYSSIFIWAHSNGGQIALTTLEVSGVGYPTVLWAPVSKPFPYSVLYYTDESEDKGKLIRSELAKFESLYDVELYSFDNYLGDINAPLQIEQGTADDAVPLSWSKALVAKLKNLDKDVTLYTYQGADHNLQPAWNTVVEADINFYKAHLQ